MDLNSAIYEGTVVHRRHAPRAHGFRYGLFQLYVDLAELDRIFADRWLWSVDRPNVACLRREDAYGDPSLSVDEAVRRRVHEELGERPLGPIRMLTHARYFGTTMNPVSFYYGFAEDGRRLEWVLAEITNTPWEERHAYLLPVSEARRVEGDYVWDFDKRFHVSPFVGMERRYRWRFRAPSESLVVHMDVDHGAHREFDATLILRRRPLDGPTLASCLARHPFLTAKVGLGIYWQAARLALKRTPFHPHPSTLGGARP